MTAGWGWVGDGVHPSLAEFDGLRADIWSALCEAGAPPEQAGFIADLVAVRLWGLGYGSLAADRQALRQARAGEQGSPTPLPGPDASPTATGTPEVEA